MPKPNPLVCQHLEKVPRAVLEEIQQIIREYVRGRNGVYALYRRGRLYYVGLASDLRVRLRAHLKDRHAQSWDSFSIYLTIGDSHLRELESLVVRIVRPHGNSQLGSFARSENLRARFAKDLRAHYTGRLRRMLGVPPCKPANGSDSKAVLAKYVNRPMRLRARYKGRLINARILRDGRIRLNGSLYNSPSTAAETVVGRACSGWTFWSVERAPGDWVKLHELR